MYLRSITLKGFKSFPDRTRLEFGPGVSVVVGPNGSGKSNITDAVLWALGEQSPGAVRGQSMQDVIFAGAPGRQAGKSAEVELVLDDAEGSLGLGVPEISIVRRLDRSGEGEYRLAGARCRLVDVIELLSDTGLGKEMHSVISQGRVESIVTSKPRDRRLLVEEAAGLGKHRKRRRRAQLKLERTHENLDRGLDVEREARSRLRPLKRQAEAAELHARIERQVLEARWELARDQLRERLAALEHAQSAAARARAGREALERELARVSKRREEAEEALAARSARREELSRRCFVSRSAGERISYRADAARAAQRAIELRLDRSSELIGSLNAQADRDVPDAEADRRIAALESALAALQRDREAELDRELEELEQQRAQLGRESSRCAEAVDEARRARELADIRLERGREAVRAAERRLEATRRESARLGGELAIVNQFLRSQASAQGAGALLADELKVDPGYELAAAAVLDGRLGAAVVQDRAAATSLLDRATADGGRALVANGRLEESRGQPPVSGAQRLLDHVRASGTATALVDALLEDTWVVETLESIGEEFDGVAVTMGGRVWSPRMRELRQAPAVGEDRALSERNRRDELIRASEAALSAELTAAAALERAGRECGELELARDRAVAEHRAAVRARDEIAEEERRTSLVIERRRTAPDDGPAAARRVQLEAELAAQRQTLERSTRERAERTARIERLRAASARDEALVPIVARVVRALDDVGAAIAGRLEAFESALIEDRQAGEDVAAELRTCAQQEATLHAKLHAENEALTEREVRLQRARDQAGDSERELRELAARLELDAMPAEQALSDQERAALSGRLERLARRRDQIGPVNPLAQQEYAEALEHVEELERQRSDLETALRELEKLIADTDRQIRETFEQTFVAAARNFEELVEHLFPGGKGRLRLVTERQGPERVLGGHTRAGESEETGELDDASESDPPGEEDLLGVEIEITPAGKAMRRLSLLSGGEKSMTALAFLFAVFLARPCPFYILDEVEAALDDLNIDRFLELLRRYCKRAQFIVVTHQKRTMEAADSLYGVSMGTDGVSKVVSRRLESVEAAA